MRLTTVVAVVLISGSMALAQKPKQPRVPPRTRTFVRSWDGCAATDNQFFSFHSRPACQDRGPGGQVALK